MSQVYLWVALGMFVMALLLRVHWSNSPDYRDASLFDLVGENGRFSSRKFMEFGAFAVFTVVVIVSSITGKVSDGMVALLIGYAGVFAGTRLGGQAVHAMTSASVRKAQIMRDKEVDIDLDDPRESGRRRGTPD